MGIFDLLKKYTGTGNSVEAELNLDEYEISDPLFFGSRRAVSQAVHQETGKVLALKHVSPRLEQISEKLKLTQESLIREAAIGRALSHPNIVKTYGLSRYDDVEYVVMDYIHDGSLLDVIRNREDYHFPQLIDFCHQVAKALAYLHHAKVIHRDIKPGNILFSGEQAMVADFGLATAEGVRGYKDPPPRSGTPKYMSPEQTRAWRLAPTSDIYSLGIMMYELFTGEMELRLAEITHRAEKTFKVHFDNPSRLNPRIPDLLDKLIMKCLQNSRQVRPPNGYAVMQELEKLLDLDYKA